MGSTYLVRDMHLGYDVALKLLSSETEEHSAALRQEFLTLKGLVHPHLAQVYDFGLARDIEGGSRSFYTAAYIEGVTASEHCTGRRWGEALRALADALEALGFLHQLGLRHGDFKPDNIIVDGEGRGTLIDLGCSALLGAPPSETVSGTVAFMAPELRTGGTLDLRTDLYAVGVTLESLADFLGPPEEQVERLTARLTSDDPRDRPADVEQVLEALGFSGGQVRAPALLASRLVGRAKPLEAFDRLLRNLLRGRSGQRALHVYGQEGVGRSHLFQEIKGRAQLECDVVEGSANGVAAVTSVLARAIGETSLPSTDALEIVRARDVLARRVEPIVLLIDDAHRLDPDQRGALQTLVGVIEENDPIGLVTTGDQPLGGVSSTTVSSIELEPLTVADVTTWLGSHLSTAEIDTIMGLTGGLPGELFYLATRIATADLAADQLDGLAVVGTLSKNRLQRLLDLSPDERSAVTLIAAAAVVLRLADLVELEVRLDTLRGLVEKGWVRPNEAGFSLARPTDAARICEELGSSVVEPIHQSLVELLEKRRAQASAEEGDAQRAVIHGALCLHLTAGGKPEKAGEELLAGRPLFERYGHSFRRAAEALQRSLSGDGAVALAVAEVLFTAGDPVKALEALEDFLDEALPAPSPPHYLLAGRCCTTLGRVEEAAQHLERVRREAEDPELRAEAAELLSLAQLKGGDYEGARRVAEQGLEEPCSDMHRAELLCDAAMATSCLGRSSEASAFAQSAKEHSETAGTPRTRYRALSACAFVEYRLGNTEASARFYEKALAVAEEHRLGPQLVTSLTNYAASCHQLGDWGRALDAYERGVRMASALEMVGTRNNLTFNLARTYADIGQWERAEHHGLSTLDEARIASSEFIEASAQTVLAEASMAQGEQQGAAKLLLSARATFERERAPRELVETILQLFELDLAKGEAGSARSRLDDAESIAGDIGAPDIVARCTLARSQLHLARGDAAEALAAAEEAARVAEGVGQRKLSAEVEGVLALAYDRLGSAFLADRHRDRALALWERIAASLPEHLRDTFFRHPLRAAVRSANQRPLGNGDSLNEEVRSLRRYVQVSRRLNSATTRDEVVESAMDAAIELTGAERGFLILAEGTGRRGSGRRRLRVAVARNVDREKVGKAHLKFSRSISEQVIETAEPVLTVDAVQDPRFSTQRSVHAMRLKSVACVPIDSPVGVLGAIYLDNRFQQGGFGERDINLLLAFSDTVAVALTKASVHDELVRRTRELEAERQRAEALMASQAQHIDKLSHELQERRQLLDRQYDYSAIVASSTVMERVFDLLDRVVPSELTVLIEGESGTGKELVARAIHWNGPRSDGPFVPINCGALTETLLESELFGYRRGAFTGATADHTGLFESASGGTLFLDEIGEMSPTMQIKLLRAIQDRRVRPVGSNETIPIDVRLICATNRTLTEEVQEGRFRQDLYYRIAVVRIEVPPLRQRGEDIPAIAMRILENWAKHQGRSAPKLEALAIRTLLAHRWPGNVRELENVLTRACLMSDGEMVRNGDLDLPSISPDGRPLRGYRPGEAARMQSVLEATGWNVSEAARTLGMPRATFYRKLKRYRIDRP